MWGLGSGLVSQVPYLRDLQSMVGEQGKNAFKEQTFLASKLQKLEKSEVTREQFGFKGAV